MVTFLRAEAIEEGTDPAPRRLDRAFRRVTEEGLELGEDLFNRVEIGRIGGQEAERGPRPLDSGPHGGPLVATEIVQDDDITGRQRGEKALFYISKEARAVDRAVEDTGSGQTVAPEGRYEGQGVPMPMGPCGDQSLAAGTAPMAAGHIGLGPRLINEHQPAGIKLALGAPPPGPLPRDVRTRLLGGRKTFF